MASVEPSEGGSEFNYGMSCALYRRAVRECRVYDGGTWPGWDWDGFVERSRDRDNRWILLAAGVSKATMMMGVQQDSWRKARESRFLFCGGKSSGEQA